MTIVLKTALNSAGEHNGLTKIDSGAVDKSGDWGFSAEDGNKLLGANGDDWANYAKWFLGTDPAEDSKTKAHYKYPFGKDGKVYRAGLIAVRQRAAQQSEDAIYAAAGRMVDKIDGKAVGAPAIKAPSMIQRAWSRFEVKAADDASRVLTGIASTPTPDRVGDVVEPDGAAYDLPLPFLWQHNSDEPIGHVVSAKPNKDGIPVEVRLLKIEEPGVLKDRLDTAWQSIKYRLVRGMSIGFAPLEYAYMKETGGYRFLKWAWLELSAVTIPANAEASIETIKSYGGKSAIVRPVVRLGPSRRSKSVAHRPGSPAEWSEEFNSNIEIIGRR